MHDFAIVYGYDRDERRFLVDDRVSGQSGDIAPWDSWPSDAIGRIDFFSPVEPVEVDPVKAVVASLAAAEALLDGDDANTGTRGLERWADAFDSDIEVDRAGNAYTLQVLQAARLDGADYLASLRELFPDANEPLGRAVEALQSEVKSLAPLITLFPFPAGGHGNVANPGLREAAATALRRAAAYERALLGAIVEARRAIEAAT
jgi:hypothetical protein